MNGNRIPSVSSSVGHHCISPLAQPQPTLITAHAHRPSTTLAAQSMSLTTVVPRRAEGFNDPAAHTGIPTRRQTLSPCCSIQPTRALLRKGSTLERESGIYIYIYIHIYIWGDLLSAHGEEAGVLHLALVGARAPEVLHRHFLLSWRNLHTYRDTSLIRNRPPPQDPLEDRVRTQRREGASRGKSLIRKMLRQMPR